MILFLTLWLCFANLAFAEYDVNLIKQYNRDSLVNQVLSGTFDCDNHGTVVEGCCLEALEMGCFYHEIYFWHHKEYYAKWLYDKEERVSGGTYPKTSDEFDSDTYPLSSLISPDSTITDIPRRYADYYAWRTTRSNGNYDFVTNIAWDLLKNTPMEPPYNPDIIYWFTPGLGINNMERPWDVEYIYKYHNDWSVDGNYPYDQYVDHDARLAYPNLADDVCAQFDQYAIACSGRSTLPEPHAATSVLQGHTTGGASTSSYIFNSDVACSDYAGQAFIKFDKDNLLKNDFIIKMYQAGFILPDKPETSPSCNCLREILKKNPTAAQTYSLTGSRCEDIANVDKGFCEITPCGEGACVEKDFHTIHKIDDFETEVFNIDSHSGTTLTSTSVQIYGTQDKFVSQRYVAGELVPEHSGSKSHPDTYSMWAIAGTTVEYDYGRECTCYAGWGQTPDHQPTPPVLIPSFGEYYIDGTWEGWNMVPIKSGYVPNKCDVDLVYCPGGVQPTPESMDWAVSGPVSYVYHQVQNYPHDGTDDIYYPCIALLDETWGISDPEEWIFQVGENSNINQDYRNYIQTGTCKEANASYYCECWNSAQLELVADKWIQIMYSDASRYSSVWVNADPTLGWDFKNYFLSNNLSPPLVGWIIDIGYYGSNQAKQYMLWASDGSCGEVVETVKYNTTEMMGDYIEYFYDCDDVPDWDGDDRVVITSLDQCARTPLTQFGPDKHALYSGAIEQPNTVEGHFASLPSRFRHTPVSPYVSSENPGYNYWKGRDMGSCEEFLASDLCINGQASCTRSAQPIGNMLWQESANTNGGDLRRDLDVKHDSYSGEKWGEFLTRINAACTTTEHTMQRTKYGCVYIDGVLYESDYHWANDQIKPPDGQFCNEPSTSACVSSSCQTPDGQRASDPGTDIVCTPGVTAGFTCECDSDNTGWKGALCTESVDDCVGNPCAVYDPDATCTDGHKSFTCTCGQWWQGDECQYDINECDVDDATMQELTGADGTLEKNNEFHSACNGRGVCTNKYYKENPKDDPNSANGITVHTLRGFVCECIRGFEGDICDECPAGSGWESGVSTRTINGVEIIPDLCYECRNWPKTSSSTAWYEPCRDQMCKVGYGVLQGDGFSKESHPNSAIYDIATNSFVYGNSPTDWSTTDGQFTGIHQQGSLNCVTCPQGKTSNIVGSTGACQNIICLGGASIKNPSIPTEPPYSPLVNCADQDCGDVLTCQNGGGVEVGTTSRDGCTCQCTYAANNLQGWTGAECETNIDECDGGTHNCHANAQCTDTDGSFTCACKAGYEGNGVECTDVDECAANPCGDHGTCSTPSLDMYMCTCAAGWQGTNCDVAGGCSATVDASKTSGDDGTLHCINGQIGGTTGDCTCTCVDGVVGASCTEDLDECASSPCEKGVCTDSTNNTDINFGDFNCACPEGWTSKNCSQAMQCRASSDDTKTGDDGWFYCIHGGSIAGFTGNCGCNQCDNGWGGPNCATDVDECDPNGDQTDNPCQNGASCIDSNDDPTRVGINAHLCVCATGFTGSNCDQNIDDCVNHNCDHGVCVDGIADYTCDCAEGYEGTKCDKSIDDCALSTYQNDPCLNEGQCRDGYLGYLCNCVYGFKGNRCQTAIFGCDDNPCLNGATCNNLEGAMQYSCTCPAGYDGYICGDDINECDPNNNGVSPCQNGGACSESSNSAVAADTFVCNCANGYSGTVCSYDIDECDSSPCNQANSYFCQDSTDEGSGVAVGEYYCDCKPGYVGDKCETDVDECAWNLCQHGSLCQDSTDAGSGVAAGEYSCNCAGTGYKDTHCDVDIDECEGDNDLGDCNQANTASCQDSTDAGSGVLINARKCNCKPGYEGDTCGTDINECEPSPCVYGTCSQTSDGTTAAVAVYHCACLAGFEGTNCNLKKDCTKDETDSTKTGADGVFYCTNGGSVTGKTGDCKCVDCTPGYDGDNCQNDINDCANNPCLNGGQCTDAVNDFTCTCAAGYNGKRCEIDINECTLSTYNDQPCLNGGTCVDEINGYSCVGCNNGWTGSRCGTDVDECTTNTDNCHNDATCANTDGSFTCTCPTRMEGNGTSCTEILECNLPSYTSDECLNGGICQDGANSYSCECLEGYEGNRCQTDTDDCAGHDCANGATCVDHLGGFSCTCADGFSGAKCDVDIDECDPNNPCQNGGLCTDSRDGGGVAVGDYECNCVGTGYKGETCHEDINECDPNGDGNANPCQYGGYCTDSRNNLNIALNDYKCDCPSGRGGKNCQDDVDECDPNGDQTDNPCVRGTCTTPAFNDFNCDCAGTGYQGKTCDVDIDECATGDHNCHANAQCTDTDGSFTCACDGGYSGNGVQCTDIDECTEDAITCSGHGTCTDSTDGGGVLVNTHLCTCAAGWEGGDCGTAKACTTSTDPLDITGSDGTFYCTNGGQASGVTDECACDCTGTGWTGTRCETNINECDTGAHDCHANAQCTDTDGSFTCECKSGYSGSGTTCTNINECDTGAHNCHANADCTDTDGSFTCACKYGYEGDAVASCTDIDECNGGLGDCNQAHTDECRDSSTPGSTVALGARYCDCKSGYEGDTCGVPSQCQATSLSSPQDGQIYCKQGVSSITDTIIGGVVSGVTGSCGCTCVEGYDGAGCFNAMDCVKSTDSSKKYAWNNPFYCANGGDMPGGHSTYTGSCECDCDGTGYDGTHCEDPLPCDAVSVDGGMGYGEEVECEHGTATGVTGSCGCSCDAGWEGDACDQDKDECDFNSGFGACNADRTVSCEDSKTDENIQIDKYECICKTGYTGDTCETDIDECANNGGQGQCVHGTCIDSTDGWNHGFRDQGNHFQVLAGNYHCGCDAGWRGTDCESSVDDCVRTLSVGAGICPHDLKNNANYCEAACKNGGQCTDGHEQYQCACSTTLDTNQKLWYGTRCDIEVVEGCMDSDKINFNPDANHDTYGACKTGDAVYSFFADKTTRLNKWMEMQKRKYNKARNDGLSYSNPAHRKQIRKAERIAIKQDDFLDDTWTKLNAMFGDRPKRMEVGDENQNVYENCAVMAQTGDGDFVGDNDDCVTTVLDDEEGQGDQKTLTRRALPNQQGAWQVIGKTIDGIIQPIIKQKRTNGPNEDPTYQMSCWRSDHWSISTVNDLGIYVRSFVEGEEFICPKTRHRVLVGSVTDYPAPCEGLLNNGCTSEQKTEAYLGRSDGVTDCGGANQDPNREWVHAEADTADCKTLGCTTQQIVDSFTCS